MAIQAQTLKLHHLPREVLDLIIEYVLRDTLLELGEPLDIHSPQFDAIVRANNKHLANLDASLALLLKQKLKLDETSVMMMSKDLLLRHATFCFRHLGNYWRLNDLRYLQVTRDQYEIPMYRFRFVKGFRESFAALRTLTVCEKMRAGANSATMRSVGFRLGSDQGLREIAVGRNGVVDEFISFDADGRAITRVGQQRCRVVLRLRVETVVPVEVTYCEAEISYGVLLHFEAASDGEEWKRVLVDGLGLRGTSG